MSYYPLDDFDLNGLQPEPRRGYSARNWCRVGLTISWILGLAAVASGALFLKFGQPSFYLEPGWKEILPLLINIIVTLLNESMGYLHGTVLRWALLEKGKLTFNSNLRLISHSPGTRANSTPANVLVFFCIVLTYATPSLTFLSYNSALDTALGHSSGLEDNKIHVSSIALVFFGSGLIGQALFTTWSILEISPKLILTWSSSPLDVLYACRLGRKLKPKEGRCMFSVHLLSEETRPIRPSPRQGSAWGACKSVKYTVILLWGIIPLVVLWGLTLYMTIRDGNPNGVLGKSWSFLPVYSTSYRCVEKPQIYCTDGTSVLNIGWSYGDKPKVVISSIFMLAGFQAVLTFGLHSVELLVNMSRDESVWRQATSTGTDSNYNSIAAACKSWQTWALLASKAIVHWLFGLSVNVSYILGINMYPPQIFYLAASIFAVALLATYWATQRPMGPQPAAYGHLQTLCNLIDEFDYLMFWGQKEAGISSISHTVPAYAGTASKQKLVSDIVPNMEYGGRRRGTY